MWLYNCSLCFLSEVLNIVDFLWRIYESKQFKVVMHYLVINYFEWNIYIYIYVGTGTLYGVKQEVQEQRVHLMCMLNTSTVSHMLSNEEKWPLLLLLILTLLYNPIDLLFFFILFFPPPTLVSSLVIFVIISKQRLNSIYFFFFFWVY